MKDRDSRRSFLASAGAGALVVACGGSSKNATHPERRSDVDTEEREVTATEDLMREHGIIRRVLVVFRESASRLRSDGRPMPVDALRDAAKLLRTFGEDYHETKLEEGYLFPALKKANSATTPDVDTLVAQHQRGRQITDFVIATTQGPVGSGAVEPLARALDAFARMYEAHAAYEDTVVFPAWKKILSQKQIDEMGEWFERIEHETFGKDGFETALAQITDIEKRLGLDLASLTAPAPSG